MLTNDQIKFVEKLRSQGFSWQEVSVSYEEKFGEKVSRDALRHRYNYQAADGDEEGSTINALSKMRRSQVAAATLRKERDKVIQAKISLDDIFDKLKELTKGVNKQNIKIRPKKIRNKQPMTIEANFGDIQIGKKMTDYNSEIARKRMQEYTSALLMKIEQHEKLGYNVERIVVNMLGDLIENDKKHKNSQRSTDTSNPEQIYNFIQWTYLDLVVPLARTGIQVDFQCVTGNHDQDDSGLIMYNPGIEHHTWIMYNSLELLCKTAGIKNVVFNIAKGAFLVYDIYGHNVLIEHGVGVGCDESSMAKRTQMRSQQVKKFISYFRMGDKHNVSRFNNDKYVVNGAFFGADKDGMEYSGILGYSTPAAQVVFCHVPRDKSDKRTTIYDSFVIQLQHIGA